LTGQLRAIRVEALVLHHKDFGEADRMLTLFTRHNGKLRALAKGARKIQSRKAGHVEPLNQATLILAHGRSFWIVSQAETIRDFAGIRADLTRTAHALYVLELLERFSFEDEENEPLFGLALETLARIEDEADLYLTTRHFEMYLLQHCGYRPELNHCLRCRKSIEAQDQFISVLLGGVLCPDCGGAEPSARPISTAVLKTLRVLQRSVYTDLEKLPINAAVRADAEMILSQILAQAAEHRLNAPRLINQIKRPIG